MNLSSLPAEILARIADKLTQTDAMRLSETCLALREVYPKHIAKCFDEDARPEAYDSFARWVSSRDIEKLEVRVDPVLWNRHCMPHLKARYIKHITILANDPSQIAFPPELPDHDTVRTGFVDPSEVLVVYEPWRRELWLKKFDGVGTMPYLQSDTKVRILHIRGCFDSFAEIPWCVQELTMVGSEVSPEDLAHIYDLGLNTLALRKCVLQTETCLRAKHIELSVDMLPKVVGMTCTSVTLTMAGEAISKVMGSLAVYPNVTSVKLEGVVVESQTQFVGNFLKTCFPRATQPEYVLTVARG